MILYNIFPKGMLFMDMAGSILAGNVSSNVYLIVFIAAAVIIAGAVIAGVIAKKKKK